jgi:hypothetical protein
MADSRLESRALNSSSEAEIAPTTASKLIPPQMVSSTGGALLVEQSK